MEYFRIRHTLNTKALGHYPQVKNVKYNCHVNNDPRFIEHYYFKKIDFTPCVATPILYAKSKKTDLIEQLGIGFSHRLLMSTKLKDILIDYSKEDAQYFQCSIFHKNIEYENYWIINPYKYRQEFIDIDKSFAKWRRILGIGNEESIVKISSLQDFQIKSEELSKSGKYLYFNNFYLKNVSKDFFLLQRIEGGGIGYFCSEKLKKEIEDTNCTGIEFQPLNLTFNEWTKKGGERENIYG